MDMDSRCAAFSNLLNGVVSLTDTVTASGFRIISVRSDIMINRAVSTRGEQ